MTKKTKILLGVGLALVVLLGGGAYWLLKDDAAERVSLDAASENADPVDAGEAVDDPSGTWSVVDGSLAGYRIDEVLTGGNNTATARTGLVEGSVVIDGTTVTAVDMTVQMGSLRSTDGNTIRDGRTSSALSVDEHPTATFTLTEPIDLGAIPEPGIDIAVTGVGDLTLNGVTQRVEVRIEARIQGSQLLVIGDAPIVLADHDITAPSAGRVVSIEDEGELEFQLILERS